MNAVRLGRFIAAEATGWSIKVFCPPASELARRCVAAGIPVADAAFPDLSPAGVPRIFGAVRSLRRELRRAGSGVIVVGGSMRAQTYAHAAAFRLHPAPPLVQFMTEQDSAERRLTTHLLRRFGSVVAVGSNAARAYEAALPGVEVVRVSNFLLPAELRGRAPRRARDGPPGLGVLARLIPEKGILELVDELAATSEAWSRLLVGGNADDPDYARLVARHIAALGLEDRVSLLGHVDDVRAFLADVDVLVVPSTGNEGQPTVILEALAADRPAIVRTHVWSEDFDGLPVFAYRDAAELARLLEDGPPAGDVDHEELERRFGPMQALRGFEVAACTGRPS